MTRADLIERVRAAIDAAEIEYFGGEDGYVNTLDAEDLIESLDRQGLKLVPA